jgi:predicted nucleic acid-binding protein
MMIYLDANIFIYAYWKPRREILPPKTVWMKAEAKKIIELMNDTKGNDRYCISLIQLAEVVNILKIAFSWEKLQQFTWSIFSNRKIEVVTITTEQYMNAVSKISEFGMDSNDISIYLIMKEKKLTMIYTFDEHFKAFTDIERLPTFPEKFD